MGYLDAGGGRRAPASPVYLDHAATTPMLPEAIEAMTEELAELGNPSSLHNAGRRARRVVEESREQIAAAYGARPSEVIFTSGGTEADNLAVKGLFWARRAADPARRRVLTAPIEHHAVLDSVGWLQHHEGAEVGRPALDDVGKIGPEALREAIETDPGAVALVSIMWANNEVGTIQPITELTGVAREYRIPFHSDAVQAAGQLPVSLADSGAAALTVTAHKIGGPVGAGALLLARGTDLVPVLHGGGQERDVRSGTLDAPAIRAFAVAVEIATARRADETKRVAGLRDDLIAQVLAAVPDAARPACALVAAPTRSPFRICFCRPAGAGVAWKTPHPAVNVAVSTAAAPSAARARAGNAASPATRASPARLANPARPADRERFSANSSTGFPLMAFFLTELE